MPDNKNILYISYDGMTDPLGQSQVLPYICGLAENGYRFSLISCEKEERFEQNREKISAICKRFDIDWNPLPFTTFPPVISKFRDKSKIRRRALELHAEKNFSMVHCRSYIAAETGLWMKQKYGTKFFFDMRGFWVDERVDGGIWNLRNPLYRIAYSQYKKKEADYIRHADKIISLTEAAVKEIKSWPSYSGASFTVVPCSADFNLFKSVTVEERKISKRMLNLESCYPVVSYLGSVGTWYLLDEMLRLFVIIRRKYPAAHFLFVTPEKREVIAEKAKLYGVSENDITVTFASRENVPGVLAASDFGISFIKTSYSKIASSPTKLGELFAMGIPVITNDKVGDVENVVKSLGGGYVLSDFSDNSLEAAAGAIPDLLNADRDILRNNSFEYYDLKKAVIKYVEAYKEVLS
jgi:glycosyltransferase involved in cell wall biosynthesis